MNREPSKHSTSDNEVLVRVANVSRKFCRNLKKSLWYGIKDVVRELNPFPPASNKGRQSGAERQDQSSLRDGEFWAVNNVSFELRRGECIGLIGRNGAGKTTLLRMLNGLIKPDRGRIEMHGRVGALIALGAGFNPILTGRENIYVNGAILGLTKQEIDAKMEQIIEFAGVDEFIDAPVQSYSSGMQVRLGFAVATAIEPEILLLDEVLAVGDVSFRVRCYNRLRDMLPTTAVIFVSHSMWELSKICSQILVMDKGATAFSGSVREGIKKYNSLNANKRATGESLVADKDANIASFSLLRLHASSATMESEVHVSLEVEAIEGCGEVRFRLAFFDSAEIPVAEWDSLDRDERFHLQKGMNTYDLAIMGIRLVAGNYRLVLVLTDPNDQGYYLRIDQGMNVALSPRAATGIAYRI